MNDLSLAARLQALRDEMRTKAMIAGQFSIEAPESEATQQAAGVAADCSQWADRRWAAFLASWVDYNHGRGESDRAWEEWLARWWPEVGGEE